MFKSSSYLIYIVILFILFLNSNENVVNAHKYGDLIRFSKKSYHDMRESEWNDIRMKFSPKFQVDKTITLSSLTSIPLGSTSLYKIAFSLDNDRFKTSWITVADGEGTFLNHIEFKFIYSNDKIVDVKWTLDYNDEEIHQKKKPDHIYLIYRWEEAQQEDITAGLFILFTVGLSISGFLFTFIAFQFQYIDTKNKSKVSLPLYESPISSMMGFNNNSNSYNNLSNSRDSFRSSNNSLNNNYSNNNTGMNDREENNLNNSNSDNTYYRSPITNSLSISQDNNNNNINNNNIKDEYDIPSESEMDSFIETKQL